MRRQLPQAGQRHLPGLFDQRARIGFVVGRQQRLGDQDVLAHALRAQVDGALDDFAGARIDQRIAVRPAAHVAMGPGDDVVADVHRVGALGHQLDPEAVGKAGLLEGFRPPARAIEQRLAHRLGRAAVQMEHDRLDHLAGRIQLQAEARLPAQVERLVERLREIDLAAAERARRRMVGARREARRRQAHEAQVLAQAERGRIDRDLVGLLVLAVAAEGEQRFEFTVVGKTARCFGQRHAALGIDPVAALAIASGQRGGDSMPVAGQVGRDVHQHGWLLAGLRGALDDRAGPQHRGRERVLGGAALVGVAGVGHVAGVVGHQQQPVAGATEARDVLLADLPAIQADVVRADSARQRSHQQERRIQLVHADDDPAAVGVAIDIDETRLVRGAVERIGDVRRSRRRRGRREQGGKNQGLDQAQCGHAGSHWRLPFKIAQSPVAGQLGDATRQPQCRKSSSRVGSSMPCRSRARAGAMACLARGVRPSHSCSLASAKSRSLSDMRAMLAPWLPPSPRT